MDEFPIDFAVPEDARAFLERLRLILDPYATGSNNGNGNGNGMGIGVGGNGMNAGNRQMGSNARVVQYVSLFFIY